ncbi:hypothetical protein Tco_0335708 [Tanacetum coccineum]
MLWIKGLKKDSPPQNLRQETGSNCCQNHKLLMTFENGQSGPVMHAQPFSKAIRVLSQQVNLVLICPEIHKLNYGLLTLRLFDIDIGFGAGDDELIRIGIHKDFPFGYFALIEISFNWFFSRQMKGWTMILFVFRLKFDGLSEFFLHSFRIIDMSSIDDAPKNLQHWSSWLFKPISLSHKAQINDCHECSPWLEHVIKSSEFEGEEKSFVIVMGVIERAYLSVSLVEGGKRSEEVGMLQNVHRNLVDWVAFASGWSQAGACSTGALTSAIISAQSHSQNDGHIDRKVF